MLGHWPNSLSHYFMKTLISANMKNRGALLANGVFNLIKDRRSCVFLRKNHDYTLFWHPSNVRLLKRKNELNRNFNIIACDSNPNNDKNVFSFSSLFLTTIWRWMKFQIQMLICWMLLTYFLFFFQEEVVASTFTISKLRFFSSKNSILYSFYQNTL